MITFTKEQLIASAHARIEFAEMMLAGELEPLKERTWSIELELARIALASLEAETVAYIRDGFRADGVHFCGGIITAEEHERTKPALSERYTWKHQPLYTAPPATVSVPDELTREEYKRRFMEDDDFDDTFRGGWNACRATMLQSFGNSEQLNSPVIPDGWVMVPVEPTTNQWAAGMQAFDSGMDKVTRVYKAMLAAAPQQEVK
ncbi:TPA: hypothetical protein HNV55_07720 [Escherichia coli]|uniref:hypothetical protein n=1 Tax=Escherichia coli TaxID=562 RepID=UPI000DA55A60|nr:hypothetical protein [Escherichia coli]EIA4232770.1 hypothetical protein [Escherichia coli]SQL30012.1 Eaa protein [Escherichia coli]SQL76090.1 Eaa protein [Escherichia coli]HAJ7427524.1 hypothetical protein [Escherichia coli]